MWTALEHGIWQNLKEYDLDSHENFILAISGGLDSMVLLEVFLKLKPKAYIKVAYYHHGNSSDKIQEEYRNQSRDVVKNRISRLNLNNVIFCTEKSDKILSSEEQMRIARWGFIRSLKTSDEIIATAHHLDDLFETMLLKMIRGTSPDGLLSFKMWNNEILRPFLETQKVELLAYAEKQKIDWVEDPSNKEEQYLRNWIRQKWLKDLDDRVEAGSKNMAKSLLKIVSSVSEKQSFDLVLDANSESTVLSRQWYVSLSKSDQLRGLALFLKKHQIYSFTSGQLEEIRKRLDKNKKDITFELLGRKWVINASQIMIQ